MAPPGRVSDRIPECELEPARRAEAAGAALDGMRQAQSGLLVERPRGDLDAAGKTARAQAGGNRDRREPDEVERRGRPNERVDDGLVRSAELVRELVVPLRRGRDRRGD